MKKLLLKASLALTAGFPAMALGQTTNTDGLPDAPDTIDEVTTVLDTAGVWMFRILMGIGVLFILWAGFLYVTSMGDSDRVKNAKQALLYAVIAIVVAVLAGAIPTLIDNLITS